MPTTRRFILLLLGLWTVTTVSAQRVVQGTVRGEELLVGATVRVKELTGVGTVTDPHGRYTLTLPDTCKGIVTVEARMVGYKTENHILDPTEWGDKREKTLDIIMREEHKNLETVVVTATRTPKLLKDVPVITRVIARQDIENSDVSTVQDLLQNEMPGIEFTFSMNQQVNLNMQGFGGNSVLFLVDGERMAGETLDNIDYSRLNLDNVDHVEIVKGAASSIYGSNAVGGVVNLISRNRRDPWHLKILGNYGSLNRQRYSASFGTSGTRVDSETDFSYASADAVTLPSDGAYSTIYANHNHNVKERITFRPTDKLKLTARAGYFFRERESMTTSYDRYRDLSAGLKSDYIISPQSDMMASYSFDQYDKSLYAVGNGTDVRNYSNVQHTVRAIYNHTFNIDTNKGILTFGGDFLRDYLSSYQFDANEGAPTQYTSDAFCQWDWSPSRQFNIVSALRYDYYSEASASHLSPKICLMYKLPNLSLRASYANGFRAPTLKEMYMQFDMANIFMIYGNPDLKSEVSDNFNLSAEYNQGHYNLTIMGFHNHVVNRITTFWNKARNGMVYANMEPVNISGIDCNASARWDNGLGVRLSYIYTYESVDVNGMKTSTTRPHTATLRIDYAHAWRIGTFNIALNGRLLSAVTCDEYTSYTDMTQTERNTYPGYTLWKITFNQRFTHGITLTLAVDNLFDYTPDYYYSNSPATIGRTYNAGLSIDVDKLFN